MAPSAMARDLPPVSSLSANLAASKETLQESPHPQYLHHLASQILYDLQYQHYWTSLTIHTHSPWSKAPLPRPILSGIPPRRAYIHPDEQVEILKEEHKTEAKIEQFPEREWVLPSHLQEKWSLKSFAELFDMLDVVPPGDGDEEHDVVGWQWRGKNRQKRLLLATLTDDSTVVYYIMHDGIVKPRQN